MLENHKDLQWSIYVSCPVKLQNGSIAVDTCRDRDRILRYCREHPTYQHPSGISEWCIFRYKWLPSAAILLNFFEKPCKLSTNSSNCNTKLLTSSNSHPSYQQSGLEPEVQGRFCWQLRPNPTCSRRVLHPNATPEAWLASPSNMHGHSNEGKAFHSRFTHQCNPLCESFFIIIIIINI